MTRFNDVAGAVTDLVTTDIGRRGTIDPIVDATTTAGPPHPAMRVAERLVDTVDPGDVIVIATGFPIPPAMVPETDGPVGAASLARAVDRGLDATPIVACEPGAADVCSAAATAAGLCVLDRETCVETAHATAVDPLSTDPTDARTDARDLAALDPSAVMTVEKAGPNRDGVYHNMAGYDITDASAKVDALFETLDASTPTIAVGDSGNEIGMGAIEDAVREEIEYGDVCQCDCGAGIACATETAFLVPAAVSNWGAHAIVACLSTLLDRELLHDPAVERRMLLDASAAGGIDGIGGGTTGWCDGLPPEIHESIVRLLREIPRESVHDRGGGELGR